MKKRSTVESVALGCVGAVLVSSGIVLLICVAASLVFWL